MDLECYFLLYLSRLRGKGEDWGVEGYQEVRGDVFKKLDRSQMLSNFIFTDSFLNLEYQGKKCIIFVFLDLGFFMVKLSFEI